MFFLLFLAGLPSLAYGQNCVAHVSNAAIFQSVLYDKAYTHGVRLAHSLREIDSLMQAGNLQKSVMYIDWSDSTKPVVQRMYVLPDGRVLEIANTYGDIRYDIILKCRKGVPCEQERVAECEVDSYGKILFLLTFYHIDPAGKSAAVLYDKKTYAMSEGITLNGMPMVYCSDSLVVRYQKLVNEIIPFLSTKRD